MKTEALLKSTIVDVYNNVRNSHKRYNTITLYDWLFYWQPKFKDFINDIRKLNMTDQASAKLQKSKLPLVAMSAAFYERKIEKIEYETGIISIDIDGQDNKHISDWESLKDELIKEKYMIYVGLSTRGNGIFCLVYYDTSLDFVEVWNALNEKFKSRNIVIDESCKDITRLRFMSYDERPCVNETVEPFTECIKSVERLDNLSTNRSNTIDLVFAYKAVYYLITECGYRSNTYNEWLKDAFRLSNLGSSGKVLFMYLSQVSEKYNEREALKKFENCYINNKYDESCILYYYSILKNKLGKNWIKVIEDYKIK